MRPIWSGPHAATAGLRVFARPARSLALRGSAATGAQAVAALAAHAREIGALADSLDPDLIVAWGMRSAIAALVSGRRYVFAHNDLLPGPMVGAAVRAAAWRARGVVALSEAIARELPDAAVEVLHPGVEVEAFARADRPPVAPPEVIVLGALVGWKRPDLALEALALARREVPELRLALVGAPLDGETALVDRLRSRAQRPDLAGAVTLGGFDPDPRAALARATCLLHCAPREPFGVAVLESLAAARPAVVPDAAGPAEIVDASCGIRYPPGDAAAAARALVDVVRDPAEAAAMGRRGRERAREKFGRARARARFRELVDAYARSPGGPPRAAPVAPSSLAIVTVTHNSARDLSALLDSVAAHLPGAEVVVVDCASTDDSVAVARARGGVTAIALRENVGFGRACNRGVRAVGAAAVALLNPDVELIDDSLLALAAEALAPGRPPRLLAPRVLNGDGSLQDTVHPRPGSPADLVRAVVPPAVVPAAAGGAWLAPWRSARPRRVGWAVGCALVARTETLVALGPFDEDLFLYGEDLELGLHASQRGIETWLSPAARVIHHRAHSTAAAFGGEPFHRLARGRHDAVARRLGPGRAALDDRTQAVTFASRLALRRMVGRRAERERRQLAAVAALRRGR